MKYTNSSFSVWCTCDLQCVYGTAVACRKEAKCQEAIFVCSFAMWHKNMATVPSCIHKNSNHYFVLLDQAISLSHAFSLQLATVLCAHTIAVAERVK